jgi:hypothetical protein
MGAGQEPLFSATLLLDQLEVMRELYGDAEVGAAIEALPDGARRELAELVHGAWCSIAAAIETVLTLARRTRPKLTWMRRAGEVRFAAVWSSVEANAR